jgi:hypothetical protein
MTPGALRGIRRGHHRNPASDQRDIFGKLGFSALEYIGGGKRAEIVLDGGIGCNMPANTTFGLNTDSLPAALSPEPQLRQAVRG